MVLDHFQAFVRPLGRPTLTPFCIRLTGIRQADVDAAPLFPAGAQALREFADRRRAPDSLWASWGAYDRKQLSRDYARHGIGDPLQLRHENLKRLFAEKQQNGREVALGTACQLARLKREGTYHRALDDAITTAHLLPWILGARRLGDVASDAV